MCDVGGAYSKTTEGQEVCNLTLREVKNPLMAHLLANIPQCTHLQRVIPTNVWCVCVATLVLWGCVLAGLAEDFLSDYIQVNIGSLDLCANHNILQIIEMCEEYEKDNK